MSTQITVEEFLILQSLMVITGNESALVCTYQRLGGVTLEEKKMIEVIIKIILGIALKQGA